jgi:septal ring factor EnvC (AmiA/AmiB activator)
LFIKYWSLSMSEPETTLDAEPDRGASAPLRVVVALALVAGAGAMVWVGSNQNRAVAEQTPTTIEDRVAALTAGLMQVKAATAKLRESQGNTSAELSHIRAGLANAEIGLATLNTTTDKNEARRRDMAVQIESKLAQLKDETLHLRTAQDDTSTKMSSLRAHVVNSEIGVDQLRTTTAELSQQIGHIEAAGDVTGSVPMSHRHHHHRRWMAHH